MSGFELLIADSLVPSDFAPDLLRGMALPALDLIAAHGTSRDTLAAHQALLPAWQAWPVRDLAHPDLALGWSRHFNLLDVKNGQRRYVLEPVHFEVDTRGLSLADPRKLAIEPGQAETLVASIKYLLQDESIDLHCADSHVWLIDLPESFGLEAPVAALALHQDVLPFMPKGPGALKWRRMANEIQMVLHEHVLNDARQAQGLQAINGVWLSGGAKADPAARIAYRSLKGFPAWMSALPQSEGASIGAHAVTSLSEAYFEEDWSTFRNALTGIDAQVRASLDALRAGSISTLSLVMTGGEAVRELSLRRSDLYKFWRRGKAVDLFDMPQ